MIVDKKSWHYRLQSFWSSWDWTPPKTLCGYFWGVVGAIFKAVLLSTLGAFFVSFIPILLWSWLRNGSPTAALALLLLATGVTIVASFAFGEKMYRTRIRGRLREASQSTSMLGITIATAKAWKQKVCPFISYKE